MIKNFKIAYYRIFQFVFKCTMPILPWRKPELIEGENSISEIPRILIKENIKQVLIVTDNVLFEMGLLNPMINSLNENSIGYTLYDQTVPNPTISNIEDALKLYNDNNCKAIIAFGGGSPMDCAKAVGARVARPNKKIPQLKGVLKVLFKTPPIIAVPTTAGTGSEVTLAAVISNSQTNEKYAINDTALIPNYAILDPNLLVNLPAHITSTTGMDAMTHAVEAFIGNSNTSETTDAALTAVKLIHENLIISYHNPKNLTARANMQKASYLAGVAFTRAYVGYIHAIAHTLGGFYKTPHGLANAVIMPHVLDAYGDSVYAKLAKLADYIKLTDYNQSDEVKAKAFIQYLRNLNTEMNIPTQLDGIKSDDFQIMVKRALDEANPLYPVPEIWFEQEMIEIYNKISK